MNISDAISEKKTVRGLNRRVKYLHPMLTVSGSFGNETPFKITRCATGVVLSGLKRVDRHTVCSGVNSNQSIIERSGGIQFPCQCRAAQDRAREGLQLLATDTL
jgi:hypothetical protein